MIGSVISAYLDSSSSTSAANTSTAAAAATAHAATSSSPQLAPMNNLDSSSTISSVVGAALGTSFTADLSSNLSSLSSSRSNRSTSLRSRHHSGNTNLSGRRVYTRDDATVMSNARSVNSIATDLSAAAATAQMVALQQHLPKNTLAHFPADLTREVFLYLGLRDLIFVQAVCTYWYVFVMERPTLLQRFGLPSSYQAVKNFSSDDPHSFLAALRQSWRIRRNFREGNMRQCRVDGKGQALCCVTTAGDVIASRWNLVTLFRPLKTHDKRRRVFARCGKHCESNHQISSMLHHDSLGVAMLRVHGEIEIWQPTMELVSHTYSVPAAATHNAGYWFYLDYHLTDGGVGPRVVDMLATVNDQCNVVIHLVLGSEEDPCCAATTTSDPRVRGLKFSCEGYHDDGTTELVVATVTALHIFTLLCDTTNTITRSLTIVSRQIIALTEAPSCMQLATRTPQVSGSALILLGSHDSSMVVVTRTTDGDASAAAPSTFAFNDVQGTNSNGHFTYHCTHLPHATIGASCVAVRPEGDAAAVGTLSGVVLLMESISTYTPSPSSPSPPPPPYSAQNSFILDEEDADGIVSFPAGQRSTRLRFGILPFARPHTVAVCDVYVDCHKVLSVDIECTVHCYDRGTAGGALKWVYAVNPMIKRISDTWFGRYSANNSINNNNAQMAAMTWRERIAYMLVTALTNGPLSSTHRTMSIRNGTLVVSPMVGLGEALILDFNADPSTFESPQPPSPPSSPLRNSNNNNNTSFKRSTIVPIASSMVFTSSLSLSERGNSVMGASMASTLGGSIISVEPRFVDPTHDLTASYGSALVGPAFITLMITTLMILFSLRFDESTSAMGASTSWVYVFIPHLLCVPYYMLINRQYYSKEVLFRSGPVYWGRCVADILYLAVFPGMLILKADDNTSLFPSWHIVFSAIYASVVLGAVCAAVEWRQLTALGFCSHERARKRTLKAVATDCATMAYIAIFFVLLATYLDDESKLMSIFIALAPIWVLVLVGLFVLVRRLMGRPTTTIGNTLMSLFVVLCYIGTLIVPLALLSIKLDKSIDVTVVDDTPVVVIASPIHAFLCGVAAVLITTAVRNVRYLIDLYRSAVDQMSSSSTASAAFVVNNNNNTNNNINNINNNSNSEIEMDASTQTVVAAAATAVAAE
eukprot:PhM_4_TR16555/c0_g1_i1/m.101300